MVSVDGYFAGPNGEIDWHVVDDEFNQYAIELLKSVDTLIFGRITYDLMYDYWPKAHEDPKITPADLEVAEYMNKLHKIVFSEKEVRLDWDTATVHHTINPADITAWKSQPGKDMVIFGSGTIVKQCTELGLIDEYRFIVAPVILGKGRSMFEGLAKSLKLDLLKSQTLGSGNIILFYQPSSTK